MDGLLIVTGASGVGKSSVSAAVAATLERSVHLRVDDFLCSVVGGWVDPWLPDAAQQNDAVGRAVIAAAMQFVAAGYTVVVDGTIFPDAIDELAPACREHQVPLHYVVLRCPFDVARERRRRPRPRRCRRRPAARVRRDPPHPVRGARRLRAPRHRRLRPVR